MYLQSRWKSIPEEELRNLEVYLEQVNLYPGSGEFALKEVLGEGVFAIKPIFNRIRNTPVLLILEIGTGCQLNGQLQMPKRTTALLLLKPYRILAIICM